MPYDESQAGDPSGVLCAAVPATDDPVGRAERIRDIVESIKYAIQLRNRLAEENRLDGVLDSLKAAGLLNNDATTDVFQLEIVE